MMLDADFDAHYQAGRDAFRLGRGREAIATINHNSAFRLGVEDAVKQGDPSIAAALIPLLEDPEPAVAVEAAYLLGSERMPKTRPSISKTRSPKCWNGPLSTTALARYQGLRRR